jgi:ABC-type cobalamin/Fe3+-siderophores transport system ATPase subunit
MDGNIAEFIKVTSYSIEQFKTHTQIAFESKASDKLVLLYDNVISILKEYIIMVSSENLRVNYLIQFQSDIQETVDFLPYQGQPNNNFILHNERSVREYLESFQSQILELFLRLSFNLNFFKQIGHFNNNIVAVGANGSGKTSLSYKLRDYMYSNGVVISAQRVLSVSNFNAINNPSFTLQQLKGFQSIDKTNKNPDNLHHLTQEFDIVLKNLLADNTYLANKFRTEAIKLAENGLKIEAPISSNLEITMKIWNSLIEHRKLQCIDGMNISVSFNGSSYNVSQMSDGEKVMLFLIAQAMQAPENGFIIIDEPEMYLHKTILKKLWDILEKQRQDCIFIYLTHDLDFATSRITAKKIWIKSFKFPGNWDIEDIPENEMPEPLILELLGSRKNILFCEGNKGSIDEKVFNLLFPQFTVTPVGGCFQVINYTKAFNKISSLQIKAYGIIDSDHHLPARLNALEEHHIYNFSVSEIENLLLDESLIDYLSKKIMADSDAVPNIKRAVLSALSEQREIQASNYVSQQVDYYFKDTNFKKANSLDEAKSNLDVFNKEVDLDKTYNERLTEINSVILSNDYLKAISIFNNKGLKSIVNNQLKITDFTERAIRLLQIDENTHKYLLKYFPTKLIEAY